MVARHKIATLKLNWKVLEEDVVTEIQYQFRIQPESKIYIDWRRDIYTGKVYIHKVHQQYSNE